MVTIRIFGQTLRASVEDSEIQCEVVNAITTRELLLSNQDKLGGLVQFMNASQLMITINNKVSTLDSQVHDGDTVKITHQFNPEYEGTLWHNP